MWGFIINSIQAAGLEHNDMYTANWNSATVGILIGYTVGPSFATFPRQTRTLTVRILAMFILYTFAPLIYRTASSVYYNMSLLSSEFYALIFGMCLS